MSPNSSNRIEEKVRLRAPRARVWRALTDAEEFGHWFGLKGLGPLKPGATVRGSLTHKGFEHVSIELTVERMEPERLFSYRWHPYAIDPAVDYTGEPKTLVVFELEDVAPNGTVLRVSETGFDRLPAGRREEAYREHTEGWGGKMKDIEEYLTKAA